MAFKFMIISGLLAVASAGYLVPVSNDYIADMAPTAKADHSSVKAVATTHQNVVRSFGGTVSQYTKSINSPHSSVHKEDTRVNNNVYIPTVAKTVTYAMPVVAKSVSYAPASTAVVYTKHSAPFVTKTMYAHHDANHHVYAPLSPHTSYAHEQQPAHDVYSSPLHNAASAYTNQHVIPPTASTTYNHGPSVTTYSHNSPSVSAYGSSQTIHYSPAEMVSHMSFDGFGTHWNF